MNPAQYMLSDAAHCYPRLFDTDIMGEKEKAEKVITGISNLDKSAIKSE